MELMRQPHPRREEIRSTLINDPLTRLRKNEFQIFGIAESGLLPECGYRLMERIIHAAWSGTAFPAIEIARRRSIDCELWDTRSELGRLRQYAGTSGCEGSF